MFEFLRKLFAPEPRSSDMARERLRLVLLSDHLSLAPDVVEALKRDLLAVISQYLEIDPDHADVTFEQGERDVAMLASIPITGVRDRLAPKTPPVTASSVTALAAEPVLESAPEPAREPEFAPPTHVEPVAVDAENEPASAQSEAPVQTLQALSEDARSAGAALSRRQRRRLQRPSADFGPA